MLSYRLPANSASDAMFCDRLSLVCSGSRFRLFHVNETPDTQPPIMGACRGRMGLVVSSMEMTSRASAMTDSTPACWSSSGGSLPTSRKGFRPRLPVYSEPLKEVQRNGVKR